MDHPAPSAQLQREAADTRAAAARWLALALIVATAAIGWATRWQVVETHTGDRPAAIFLVNRWTGEIRYAQSAGVVEVQPSSP